MQCVFMCQNILRQLKWRKAGIYNSAFVRYLKQQTMSAHNYIQIISNSVQPLVVKYTRHMSLESVANAPRSSVGVH